MECKFNITISYIQLIYFSQIACLHITFSYFVLLHHASLLVSKDNNLLILNNSITFRMSEEMQIQL